LFTVTHSGQTIIDYLFEHMVHSEAFNIFMVSVLAFWLLFSYLTTLIYYACYDPETVPKTDHGEEAPNASNHDEADLENGKNKTNSPKETKS